MKVDFPPRGIAFYRWTVFLLAAFYCLYMLANGPWDGFGAPFRY